MSSTITAIPVLTTAEANALSVKPTNLVYFDTTLNVLRKYNGTLFIPLNYLALTSKTANYTATLSDDTIFGDASGGTFTVTLPTAVGAEGKVFRLKRTDQTLANYVGIATTGGQTIDGVTTRKLATQYEELTLVSDNANWQVLSHTYPKGWVSYTPSSTWTTNTTSLGKWRRDGDSIIVATNVTVTGGAPGGSNAIQHGIPTGLTIDAAGIPGAQATFGSGTWAGEDGGILNYGGVAYGDSSASIITYVSSAGSNVVTKTIPFAWGVTGTDFLAYTSDPIPITNWEN